MGSPSQTEREALLELLLAMSGPLLWTGPIPYDALGARRTAEHRGTAAAELPVPGADGAAGSRSAVSRSSRVA